MSQYIVANTADSGAGSLRQAILDGNADPGSSITFAGAVANSTINLASALPASPSPWLR